MTPALRGRSSFGGWGEAFTNERNRVVTPQEILQRSTVSGCVLTLPEVQLDRKVYVEVAKSLERIGGKWNRSKNGFLFQQDPTPLLARVLDGEQVNIKKDFQCFFTPSELAQDLIAELMWVGMSSPPARALEPSAGQGAIADLIPQWLHLEVCELEPLNRSILEEKGYTVVAHDFLTLDRPNWYDRIVANPPFTKGQDIDHIRHMYRCLAPGGRMVSVCSTSFLHRTNRKHVEFQDWLNEVDAERHSIPEGTFKSSGTMVATCYLVIDKANTEAGT